MASSNVDSRTATSWPTPRTRFFIPSGSPYACMAHARIAGGEDTAAIRKRIWIAAWKLRLVQPMRISAEAAARRGAGRPGNDCRRADESQSSWHAEDAQVIQQYFQENFWLEHLARQEQEAIWQYPDRPHCYLLTNLEAYADLYTATGDPRYHDAVLGGWKLYRDNWQQIGGSISIIEFEKDPPGSNYLNQKLGENCGALLWILLSQRLHQHDPEDEKYMSEIEKSIYNVILANQGGSTGIRYHTIMAGKKKSPRTTTPAAKGRERVCWVRCQSIFIPLRPMACM